MVCMPLASHDNKPLQNTLSYLLSWILNSLKELFQKEEKIQVIVLKFTMCICYSMYDLLC